MVFLRSTADKNQRVLQQPKNSGVLFGVGIVAFYHPIFTSTIIDQSLKIQAVGKAKVCMWNDSFIAFAVGQVFNITNMINEQI